HSRGNASSTGIVLFIVYGESQRANLFKLMHQPRVACDCVERAHLQSVFSDCRLKLACRQVRSYRLAHGGGVELYPAAHPCIGRMGPGPLPPSQINCSPVTQTRRVPGDPGFPREGVQPGKPPPPQLQVGLNALSEVEHFEAEPISPSQSFALQIASRFE